MKKLIKKCLQGDGLIYYGLRIPEIVIRPQSFNKKYDAEYGFIDPKGQYIVRLNPTRYYTDLFKGKINQGMNEAALNIFTTANMAAIPFAVAAAPVTTLTTLATGAIGSGVGGLIGLNIGANYGNPLLGAEIGSTVGMLAGGGGYFGNKIIPTYKAYRLSNAINKAIKNTTLSKTEPILNVGWSPKVVVENASWAHTKPNEVLSTNLPNVRWDVEKGMPATGGWITEGYPGGMMAKRPYIDRYKITLNKPIVQVGEVPINTKNTTRSAIINLAELIGADGVLFKSIKDNQAILPQNVTYIYDPDASALYIAPIKINGRFATRPSSITLAEKYGIPKGERNFKNRHKKLWELLTPESQNTIKNLYAINPNAYIPQGKTPSIVAVDSKGNIDFRSIVQLKNKFLLLYPYLQKNFYKKITNWNQGERNSDNLFLHIGKVVRTAQDSPVPTGTTKSEFVESALFHDIGKSIDGSSDHGKTSVRILNELKYPVSDNVKDAIAKHMEIELRDENPLTRGLHFADVARGLPFHIAAFKNPHLVYPNQKMNFTPANVPFRDLVKIANKWLSAQGYEPIKLDMSEADTWKALRDRMLQHTSFIRGVDDPFNHINPNSKFGKIIAKETERIYGENNPENRRRLALENIPVENTEGGRGGFFESKNHGLASKGLGLDLDKTDALFISTNNNVAKTYGDIKGLVSLPVVESDNLLDFIAKNDFDMYGSYGLSPTNSNMAPVGVWNTYHAPYLLQTGKSLRLKMINKYGSLMPPLEFTKQVIPLETNVKGRINTVLPELAKALGEDSPYIKSNMINMDQPWSASIRQINTRLSQINNELKLISETEESVNNLKKQILANFERDVESGKIENSGTNLLNYLREYFKEFNKRNIKELRSKVIALKTERESLLTFARNIQSGDNKAFRFAPSKESLKALSKFLNDPVKLAEVMEEEGVSPRYQFPFANDNRVIISAHAPHTNIRKNSPFDLAHTGAVIGEKGEPALNILNLFKFKDFKNKDGYIDYIPLTRKSLK